jgi:hypothetical protein
MNRRVGTTSWLPLLLLVFLAVSLTGCATHIADPDPTTPDLKTITVEKLSDTSTSYTSSGVSTVSKRYNKYTIVIYLNNRELRILCTTIGAFQPERSPLTWSNRNCGWNLLASMEIELDNSGRHSLWYCWQAPCNKEYSHSLLAGGMSRFFCK